MRINLYEFESCGLLFAAASAILKKWKTFLMRNAWDFVACTALSIIIFQTEIQETLNRSSQLLKPTKIYCATEKRRQGQVKGSWKAKATEANCVGFIIIFLSSSRSTFFLVLLWNYERENPRHHKCVSVFNRVLINRWPLQMGVACDQMGTNLCLLQCHANEKMVKLHNGYRDKRMLLSQGVFLVKLS